METDRRRFVKLALAGAVVTSGCIGGSGNGDDADGADDGGEGDTPETAEFGYENWVPTGSYQNLGYVDVARLRERTTLEKDGETVRVAGEAGPNFADVDGYISADSADAFDAYHGSFDADSIADEISNELTASEVTEHRGYTVVRGNERFEEGTTEEDTETSFRSRSSDTTTMAQTQPGTGSDGSQGEREVVVADSFVVSSGRDGATRVVDAALGEADREEEASELIQGLDEYADDPLAVVFNYGNVNAAYRFVEERDERLMFVEVFEFQREEFAQDEYNYYTNATGENATVERDGRWLVVATEETDAGAANLFLSEAGFMP